MTLKKLVFLMTLKIDLSLYKQISFSSGNRNIKIAMNICKINKKCAYFKSVSYIIFNHLNKHIIIMLKWNYRKQSNMETRFPNKYNKIRKQSGKCSRYSNTSCKSSTSFPLATVPCSDGKTGQPAPLWNRQNWVGLGGAAR